MFFTICLIQTAAAGGSETIEKEFTLSLTDSSFKVAVNNVWGPITVKGVSGNMVKAKIRKAVEARSEQQRQLAMEEVVLAGLCIPLSFLMADEEKVDYLTVPLSNPGKSGHVDVGLLKGSITITGYEGNEVDITARTRIRDVSNRERKGNGTECIKNFKILGILHILP